MQAKKSDYPFLALREPWSSNDNPVWLATTLRLLRNVDKYPFPVKLPLDQRKRLLALLSESLLESGSFAKGTFIPAEKIGPLEKEFLYEHFLAGRGFQQALEGEGFLLDSTGHFFATVNLRDHLHLQVTDCNQELEKGWNQLMAIESELSKSVTFAFSQRFGYLTSDPNQCGTGLSVQLYLHLPALRHTGKLNELLEERHDEGISARGLLGGLDPLIGDLLVLRNRRTLGVTDEAILQTMRSAGLRLVVAEKSARSQIRQQGTPALKDLVSRAFGLLIHSYQLETHEAWNALSLLKLGIDLGWLTGVDHRTVNELLFSTPRAHLICEYSQEVAQQEVAHLRAAFLHAHMGSVNLTI
jgi:protein arginine kinase